MSDGAAPATRRFPVEARHDGMRLDVFLAAVCPDLSRSRIASDFAAAAAGAGDPVVAVDGRPRPKNFRVSAGQLVAYRPGERPPLTAVPQDIALSVVHEDEHLMVIDKPAGLVVHPAVGHPDGTVVNAVLHRRAGLAAGRDPLRPGIVHRLDKNTSGLLVVALTEQAHRHLAAQLKSRRMGRVYLALTWGSWEPAAGELTGAIGRHPRRRQQMAVTAAGRPAVTRYRVCEDFGFVQLCRVELESGRTHQIRVHFAHHGHPVVGDPAYGDDRRAKGQHGPDRRRADRLVRQVARQFLHAAELHFRHPATGQEVGFSASLPPDLTAALASLRESG